jgi:acetyltransferase-like isoleucine patch superfamily enzyme
MKALLTLPGKFIHRFRKWLFWLAHARKFRQYSFSSTILDIIKIRGHEFISVGKKIYVHKLVRLEAYKIDAETPHLEIEDQAIIGNFNHIVCVHKVVIGKSVLIADRVYISDNIHDYQDITTPVLFQKVSFKKEVVISEGAWIGENVCIIGASVGKNSVVGANSVVTSDIPDYSIAVGMPARVIKKYDFEKKEWISQR